MKTSLFAAVFWPLYAAVLTLSIGDGSGLAFIKWCDSKPQHKNTLYVVILREPQHIVCFFQIQKTTLHVVVPIERGSYRTATCR